MASHKNTFPLLSPTDISIEISNFGVVCTPEQVKACDASTIQRILHVLVSRAIGLSEPFPIPDCPDATMQQFMLPAILARTMSKCYQVGIVPKLSVLQRPACDPDQAIATISAYCNYVKYHIAVIEPERSRIQEDVRKTRTDLESISLERAHAEAELQALQQKRLTEKPIVERLENETRNLLIKVAAEKEKIDQAAKSLRSSREGTRALEGELSQIEEISSNERRLRNDLRNLKDVTARLESTEARSSVIGKELESLKLKLAEQTQSSETLKEAHRLADTLHAAQEEILVLRVKYSKTSKALKELKTHQDQLENAFKSAQAAAEEATASFARKTAEFQNVSSSKVSLETKVAKLLARIDAQKAQTAATDKNLAHAKNRSRMEIDRAQADAAKLAVKAQQGHEEVENLRFNQQSAISAVVAKIDALAISGLATVNEIRAMTSPTSKRSRND